MDSISSDLKIPRTDMIEKDIILHKTLTDLSQNEFFSGNFVFKGGTCLVLSWISEVLGGYRLGKTSQYLVEILEKGNQRAVGDG